MGIRKLFSPSAELPYLSDSDAVQVSNVLLHFSTDINEKGSGSTSSTATFVPETENFLEIPDVVFNVNRPFIAVIADRNRYIPYSIAKITNPVADQIAFPTSTLKPIVNIEGPNFECGFTEFRPPSAISLVVKGITASRGQFPW
jgi:hypothetical protein